MRWLCSYFINVVLFNFRAEVRNEYRKKISNHSSELSDFTVFLDLLIHFHFCKIRSIINHQSCWKFYACFRIIKSLLIDSLHDFLKFTKLYLFSFHLFYWAFIQKNRKLTWNFLWKIRSIKLWVDAESISCQSLIQVTVWVKSQFSLKTDFRVNLNVLLFIHWNFHPTIFQHFKLWTYP